MSDFNSNEHIEGFGQESVFADEKLSGNEDLVMEQILENVNNTPIGQVLKKIASMPEVRREKVINIRRQLTEGKYDLNERLNIALDKVLEDLVK